MPSLRIIVNYIHWLVGQGFMASFLGLGFLGLGFCGYVFVVRVTV